MTDYNAPPAPPQAYTPPAENPGKVLGIVGFILAFFVSIAGLIVSIIGMVKSRKAGYSNGFALAGIIISSIAIIVEIIVVIVLVVFSAAMFGYIAEVCQQLGPGEHLVDGITYTCS